MTTRLLKMLLAIAGGNAIYFAVMKFLPPKLQHAPFRLDTGLLVDFLFCLLLWFLLQPLGKRS